LKLEGGSTRLEVLSLRHPARIIAVFKTISDERDIGN
jgi:hypothetical protein